MSRAAENALEIEVNNKLIRRRIWITRIIISAAVLVAVAIVVDHFGWFGFRGNDWERFAGKEFPVSHVLDGQTLMVEVDWSQQERVRLIGVYAPRLGSSESEPGEHFAQESMKYARARAAGQKVVLQLDPIGTRDKDGVLLAQVYLSDSEMLNLSMLRFGMAYADRRAKHSMSRQFEQSENEARTKRSGLWKELTDDRMPDWRKQWLQSRSIGR